jgi:hypothetical protein
MTTPDSDWVSLKLADIKRCAETIVKFVPNSNERSASILVSVAFLLVRCGEALDIDLKKNDSLESVLKTRIRPMLQRYYDQHNVTIKEVDGEQSLLLIQPFWNADVVYDDIEVAMVGAIEYLVSRILLIANVKTVDYSQCVTAACLIMCSYDMSRKFSLFKPQERDYHVAVRQLKYITPLLADQKAWEERKEQLAKMNYICRTSAVTNNRVRGFAMMKKAMNES